MRVSTERPSCLMVTHSRWRGDLASCSLAQSCAVATCAVMRSAAAERRMRVDFIGAPLVTGGMLVGSGSGCKGEERPGICGSTAYSRWILLEVRVGVLRYAKSADIRMTSFLLGQILLRSAGGWEGQRLADGKAMWIDYRRVGVGDAGP